MLNDRFKRRGGFTLVELLVVISIIALLMSILMPSLSRARDLARRVACQALVKQWGVALTMYSTNNDDSIPYFADGRANDSDTRFWFEVLASYLSTNAKRTNDSKFSSSKMFENEFRRCPSARRRRNGGTMGDYDCYIGVNLGLGNNSDLPFSAPFYYHKIARYESPSLKLSSISQPSEAMGFMDVVHHMVYSPVEGGGATNYRYRFDTDYDGDGKVDSSGMTLAYGSVQTPYNYARPKVHGGGSDVGLLDGHVEWVAFKELWEVDDNGDVVHPFWHVNKR